MSSSDSPSDKIEGNQDAARALLRVKQKLDGYENGDLRSLQGQVILETDSCFLTQFMVLSHVLFLYCLLSGPAVDSRCTRSRKIVCHVSRMGCMVMIGLETLFR